MDDKDLLELAAQAGICYIDSDDGAAYASVREDVDMSQYILAFASLVAAAERERLYQGALERGLVALENRGRLIDGIMEGK